MAQFAVYRMKQGGTLVVDCQSQLLDHIDSCFVIPLIPSDAGAKPARNLNPVFDIDGKTYILLTQAASAVRREELGQLVTSLAQESHTIVQALDFLITGV